MSVCFARCVNSSLCFVSVPDRTELGCIHKALILLLTFCGPLPDNLTVMLCWLLCLQAFEDMQKIGPRLQEAMAAGVGRPEAYFWEDEELTLGQHLGNGACGSVFTCTSHPEVRPVRRRAPSDWCMQLLHSMHMCRPAGKGGPRITCTWQHLPLL
jgi:hypothetical protein